LDDLEQYRQSLTAMIQAARTRNIPVLLLSPTLVSEDLNSPENLRLVEYIAAMAEVSQQTTCQYIDLNQAFKHVILTYQRYGGNSQNILTRDGIHPNLAGYQIMAYTILLGLGIPQQNLKHLQVLE
jgi:lysophospholipase L1-like esterase